MWPFLRRVGLAAVALLAVGSIDVFAQTTPPPTQSGGVTERSTTVPSRPKIGLVLSGGGARGAAHIGVLKVLEEMRVPIDVIAGTSMGSIIGAAYATGLTVPEMEAAIKTITTQALFTDKPPREDQSMRRKDDDLQPYIVPELAVSKDGVLLPKGVVTGVALEGELRKLVQATNVRDFDQLPIPFRAIATDIGTGEMVVLKEGSVVQAIRASMSVPGAVAPVTIDKRQLVDGGLVRNLPVDIARSMGADIVIAVNLGTPLLRPDQITSVLSVSLQMINILTEQNVNRSLAELKPTDVLIVPELGDYSSADFDNLTKTVPIGEAAARKVADKLRALALPPEQYAELRAKQVAPTTKGAVVVDAIRVEGLTGVNSAVVLQSMQTQVGKPLDRDTIDLDMRRIFGRGDFETVNYAVEEEPDGKRTLVVLAKEKSQRNYVRFGLELDADLGKSAEFNLLASHRMKWINSFGAEWRNDLVLGSDIIVASQFYQPLSPSQYFFVAPQINYSKTPWKLFVDTLEVAQYSESVYAAEMDVGVNFLQYGQASLGLVYGQRYFELQSGDTLFPRKLETRIGALNFGMKIDQLDSVNFPHRGFQLGGRIYSALNSLGAEDQYTRWDASLNGAKTWGVHTLEFLVNAGGKLGEADIPLYDLFDLGGFLYLSGLQRQQLKADQFTFGRLIYRTKVAEIPLFEGMYVGASIEGARLNPLVDTWNGKAVPGMLNVTAGSVYFGVDSPLGPLYIGFGYANKENRAVYLFLGRP